MELKRLTDNEEGVKKKKKKKINALKSTNIKDIESEDEVCQSKIDKYMKLMFQKFKEFLRQEKQFPGEK